MKIGKIELITSYEEMSLAQLVRLRGARKPKDENDIPAFIALLKIMSPGDPRLIDALPIDECYGLIEYLAFLQESIDSVDYKPGQLLDIKGVTYLISESVADLNRLTAGEYISLKILDEQLLSGQISELDRTARQMAILIRPAIKVESPEFGVSYKLSDFDADEMQTRAERFKTELPALVALKVAGFFLSTSKG